MKRLSTWRIGFTPGATFKQQTTVKQLVNGESVLTTANLTGARLELKSNGQTVFVFDSTHSSTPTQGQGRILIDNTAKTVQLFADQSVTAGLVNRASGELLIDSDLDGVGRWAFVRVRLNKQ